MNNGDQIPVPDYSSLLHSIPKGRNLDKLLRDEHKAVVNQIVKGKVLGGGHLIRRRPTLVGHQPFQPFYNIDLSGVNSRTVIEFTKLCPHFCVVVNENISLIGGTISALGRAILDKMNFVRWKIKLVKPFSFGYASIVIKYFVRLFT